jgi:hypothetical protein
MRFLVTAVVMGVIVVVAAALVVIELASTFAPLIAAALVVVVALRIRLRRRASAVPPRAAGFTIAGTAAAPWAPLAPGTGLTVRRSITGDCWPRPYRPSNHQDCTTIDANVIDAEVIGEDDHRG